MEQECGSRVEEKKLNWDKARRAAYNMTKLKKIEHQNDSKLETLHTFITANGQKGKRLKTILLQSFGILIYTTFMVQNDISSKYIHPE